LNGQTVAITGTTSGTGRAAAQALAAKGATLFLLNRPSPWADESLAALKAAVPDADVQAIPCDLQSFASVREAAAAVDAACPQGLDVLCNNAGVMALEDRATGDGFDVQMQTNHLSHFLLTNALFPALERAADAHGEARVVNHSSMARRYPASTLDGRYLEARGGDLGGNGKSVVFKGGRWRRYNQSKLANAAFTAALHERLTARGSKMKALVAHPGLAKTSLQATAAEDGAMAGWLNSILFLLAQSMEDGAMGILSAMALPNAQSGEFYVPGSDTVATKGPAVSFALEPFYDNAETRELLWSKSCEAIGEAFDV